MSDGLIFMSKWAGVLALCILVLLAGCTESPGSPPSEILGKITETLPMGWDIVYPPRNSTSVYESFKPWLQEKCETRIKKASGNESKTLDMSIVVFSSPLVAERFVEKMMAENPGYDSGIGGLPSGYKCFGVRQDKRMGRSELRELSLCRNKNVVVVLEALGNLDEVLSTQMMGKILVLMNR